MNKISQNRLLEGCRHILRIAVLLALVVLSYSSEMASDGQASTHSPHSTQSSSSTTAISSFIESASLGHSSTHVPHPTHFSTLIFNDICIGSLPPVLFIHDIYRFAQQQWEYYITCTTGDRHTQKYDDESLCDMRYPFCETKSH